MVYPLIGMTDTTVQRTRRGLAKAWIAFLVAAAEVPTESVPTDRNRPTPQFSGREEAWRRLGSPFWWLPPGCPLYGVLPTDRNRPTPQFSGRG